MTEISIGVDFKSIGKSHYMSSMQQRRKSGTSNEPRHLRPPSIWNGGACLSSTSPSLVNTYSQLAILYRNSGVNHRRRIQDNGKRHYTTRTCGRFSTSRALLSWLEYGSLSVQKPGLILLCKGRGELDCVLSALCSVDEICQDATPRSCLVCRPVCPIYESMSCMSMLLMT
jgi:hypothetical protein